MEQSHDSEGIDLMSYNNNYLLTNSGRGTLVLLCTPVVLLFKALGTLEFPVVVPHFGLWFRLLSTVTCCEKGLVW